MPGETPSQRELGAGESIQNRDNLAGDGEGKGQGVLPLTAPSRTAGQGPAAPKMTPENNTPGDGETYCSSLAQLAGSGPPPGRGAAGLAGENKGISGVKRLRLKSLYVAAEEPAPAACRRRAGLGGEGCWLLPGGIDSLPSPPWLGHNPAQSMPRTA